MPGLFGFFALTEEDTFHVDETPISLLQGERTEIPFVSNDPIECHSTNAKIANVIIDAKTKEIAIVASRDEKYYGDCVVSLSQSEKYFEIPVHVEKVYIDAEYSDLFRLRCNQTLDIPYKSNAYIMQWKTRVITPGENAQQRSFMRGVGMVDVDGTKKFRMICYDPNELSEGQIEEVTLTAYVQGIPITSITFRCKLSVIVPEAIRIGVVSSRNIGFNVSNGKRPEDVGFIYQPEKTVNGNVSKIFFNGYKLEDIDEKNATGKFDFFKTLTSDNVYASSQIIGLQMKQNMKNDFGFVYVPSKYEKDEKPVIRFVGQKFDEIEDIQKSKSTTFNVTMQEINMSEIKE